MCRTHGDEIVVGHGAEVARPKCYQRLRTARRRDELHANRVRPVLLNDGAEVTRPEAVCGQVSREHDKIEDVHRHLLPPG